MSYWILNNLNPKTQTACILHAPLDREIFVTISSVYQRTSFNHGPLISEFLVSEVCVHLVLLRAFSTTLDEISNLQFFFSKFDFLTNCKKILVGLILESS